MAVSANKLDLQQFEFVGAYRRHSSLSIGLGYAPDLLQRGVRVFVSTP